jgi:hypothetical protein
MKSVFSKSVACVALVCSVLVCSSSTFAWGIFGRRGTTKAPKTAKEFYNQERRRIASLKMGTKIYGRTDFAMDWMKAGQELDEIMGVLYGIEICKGERFHQKLLHFSKYDLTEPKFKFSREKDYGFQFRDILMARVGVALKAQVPRFVWCRPFRIEIQFQIPRLKSPADKATVFSLAPIFTWEASPGATHYLLELAEDGDFTSKDKLMKTQLDQDSWLTQLDGPDRTRDTDDDVFLVGKAGQGEVRGHPQGRNYVQVARHRLPEGQDPQENKDAQQGVGGYHVPGSRAAQGRDDVVEQSGHLRQGRQPVYLPGDKPRRDPARHGGHDAGRHHLDKGNKRHDEGRQHGVQEGAGRGYPQRRGKQRRRPRLDRGQQVRDLPLQPEYERQE